MSDRGVTVVLLGVADFLLLLLVIIAIGWSMKR